VFTVLRVFVAMSLGMLLRGMLMMTVRFERVLRVPSCGDAPLCDDRLLVSFMGFMVVVGRSFMMLCCV
jgi:hypothetical protein